MNELIYLAIFVLVFGVGCYLKVAKEEKRDEID